MKKITDYNGVCFNKKLNKLNSKQLLRFYNGTPYKVLINENKKSTK
jgi:hypothetical protein